ncbi:hypothetical protein [Burkholderia gladioli]|uniref:hypothetical protein n=1 Tax=Burkholderia gladioli TaxID=28095 RepID=UPI001640B02E|nr:hypothetical protein [Burkholderia gladioli]
MEIDAHASTTWRSIRHANPGARPATHIAREVPRDIPILDRRIESIENHVEREPALEARAIGE